MKKLATKEVIEQTIDCPHCDKPVDKDLVLCPFCKEDLEISEDDDDDLYDSFDRFY